MCRPQAPRWDGVTVLAFFSRAGDYRVNILVTGAAGFIGSTLSERLVAAGHTVTGIDCFHNYYDRRIKTANLQELRTRGGFTFIESNLLETPSAHFLDHEVIYHLAGQPGVRASWGASFTEYVTNNIEVTQRLLEIVKQSAALRKFVFASSSSVYGSCCQYPLTETAMLTPVSPYGVTKLTAEQLCSLYHHNFGTPTASLRFFTVYGPRQRPDMAFHRFIKAILSGAPITVYGDGAQTRDFTYVDDIVTGTMQAGFTFTRDSCRVMNIGGGKRTPLNRVFDHLAEITGTKPVIQYRDTEKGDMRDTLADITVARDILGYDPQFDLYEGLLHEYEWFRTNEQLLCGGQ